MAYCTTTELEASLAARAQAQLTADTGTTVDATVLAEVISQADARINMYLSSRFSVPVTGGTASLAYLKSVSVTIAAYLCLKRRQIHNDDFRQDYLMAIEELKAIKDGSMSLPDTDTTATDQDPRIDNFSVAGGERQIFGIILDNDRRGSTYT